MGLDYCRHVDVNALLVAGFLAGALTPSPAYGVYQYLMIAFSISWLVPTYHTGELIQRALPVWPMYLVHVGRVGKGQLPSCPAQAQRHRGNWIGLTALSTHCIKLRLASDKRFLDPELQLRPPSSLP